VFRIEKSSIGANVTTSHSKNAIREIDRRIQRTWEAPMGSGEDWGFEGLIFEELSRDPGL
jgi:hypothetical protein